MKQGAVGRACCAALLIVAGQGRMQGCCPRPPRFPCAGRAAPSTPATLAARPLLPPACLRADPACPAPVQAVEGEFRRYGYWFRDNAGTAQAQRGVFRTNCIDCLDRTNVVQVGWVGGWGWGWRGWGGVGARALVRACAWAARP